MARRKTNEEFIKEVYKLVSDEYIFLENYKGALTKILCKHNKCKNQWKIKPNEFLQGSRCPKCKITNRTKTDKQFKKEVFDLVGKEYVFLDEYQNSQTNILCKHIICGHEWEVRPNNFLYGGKRCPKCCGFYRRDNKDFTKAIYDLVRDEYIFLEEFIDTQTKIKCKHNKCGYEWYIIPNSFLQGRRCPRCSESKGEQSIRNYLENMRVDFLQEYIFEDLLSDKGNPLRYDFAILDNSNVVAIIEYDGEFHFKKQYANDGFETLKVHDKRKNQYCKNNNIPLLRIPYWEFENIEEILYKWLSKYELIHSEKIEGIT